MNKFLKKSSIIRKSVALGLQVPRAINRYTGNSNDYISTPPILANSFPKSGTHLLMQVFEALPGVKTYGSFIVSQPTLSFKKQSETNHLNMISKIVSNELISAHLFYSDAYDQSLQSKNTVHYFIYRDLRDIAISEAYYLTNMNRWHRLHPYYKALSSIEERVNFAIAGTADPDFPYDYPNIGRRFQDYRGWLDQEHVMSIRFEDLRSEETRIPTVQKMLNFYIHKAKLSADIDADALLKNALASINPSKSHTFREGKVSNWKDKLTTKQKDLIKEVAGDLLIELGYEQDMNWS